MPTDDLLTRARRAAGLSPADRDALLTELADAVEAWEAERDRLTRALAALNAACVRAPAAVPGWTDPDSDPDDGTEGG